jgi:hypothetical protein
MKHLLTVIMGLALFVLATSCSKEQSLPNQKPGKRPLDNYVFEQIAKYGGPTTNAPSGSAPNPAYAYSEDAQGCQVLCKGYEIIALLNMLSPVFGAPSLTTTNDGGLSSFVYGIKPSGVAINCVYDPAENGSRQGITHLIILRPGARK